MEHTPGRNKKKNNIGNIPGVQEQQRNHSRDAWTPGPHTTTVTPQRVRERGISTRVPGERSETD